MLQGKRAEEWEQTSSILAMIFNAVSSKKKLQPKDFNPFKSQESRQVRKPVSSTQMKSVVDKLLGSI